MGRGKRESKYTPETLIKLLRKAVKFRNECVAEGLLDNMGAIHSAERVLDEVGRRLAYPGIGHQNKYREYRKAVFSKDALKAFVADENVKIEHVNPRRALTQVIAEKIDQMSDAELAQYIAVEYQMVLLTPAETSRVNKRNRSKGSLRNNRSILR